MNSISYLSCDDPSEWGEDPDGGGYDDVPGQEQGNIPGSDDVRNF